VNDVECIICGNAIIIQPQEQFKNEKYCSEKCWNDYEI
jgi:endogenous inhibitor of DNA gyrase (YacG/DUF329 family)